MPAASSDGTATATAYRPAEAALALNTFVKLLRAANSVTSDLAGLIAGAGLTVSQFGVLEALHHLGPLRQKDLASKILKSAGNLTTVVDNLERRGLVIRRRTTRDRRVVTIHLSPAGDALIRDLFPRHAAEVRGRFAILDPDEQRQLGDLLRRLGRG